MCGLWGGLSFYLSANEREAIRVLALMNTVRGEDSTGAFFGWRKGKKLKWSVEKSVSPAWDFFSEDNVRNRMKQNDLSLIMGHDRAATLGKINAHNAHPIAEGAIIGTHNGTIQKFKPSKEEEESTSDSRILFSNISEQGPEVLGDLDDGAFAVAYVDKDKNSLFFARNYMRPLHFMWSKNQGTLLWSSEAWPLEVIAKRDQGWSSPTLLTPWTLVGFDLRTLKKLEVKKLEEKKKEPTYSGSFSATYKDREYTPQSYWGNRSPALPPPKKVEPTVMGPVGGKPEYITKFVTPNEESEIKKQVICLKPSSQKITKIIYYYNIGLQHELNAFNEIVVKRYPRNGKPVETKNKVYLGYDRQVFPMETMSRVISEGECSLCGSRPAGVEEPLYFFSKREFFCQKCVTSGEAASHVHPAQLFKGCIMDGPDNSLLIKE